MTATTSFTSNYITVLDREVHYTEWGAKDAINGHVMCWHGLLRTCRDFDTIAAALAASNYHVICVDVIGRGLSQWSPAPEAEYNVAFYAKLAAALADALDLAQVSWIGTSMGGIIGYFAASTTSLKGRIKKLVLNDIGPFVNPVAIERINSYCRLPIVFNRFTELEAFLSAAYKKPFGIECKELMRSLIEHGVRRTPDGKYSTHYDIRVVEYVAVGSGGSGVAGVDPWDVYDAVTCPTLVLRGENSDLLLPGTLEEMTRRGPKATAVTISGCGHAPALHTEEQIALVADFLAK